MIIAAHLDQLLLSFGAGGVMIRSVVIVLRPQRLDLGTKLDLALVGCRQPIADIGEFLLEPFQGLAIVPLNFLEARFQPGGTVVQAVAIEAECCDLLDCLIPLLL
jgi:hypothetical protein